MTSPDEGRPTTGWRVGGKPSARFPLVELRGASLSRLVTPPRPPKQGPLPKRGAYPFVARREPGVDAMSRLMTTSPVPSAVLLFGFTQVRAVTTKHVVVRYPRVGPNSREPGGGPDSAGHEANRSRSRHGL